MKTDGWKLPSWGTGGRALTHSDSGVPSSANWNPTKPLMRRQVYVPATRPVYIAANHCKQIRRVSNVACRMDVWRKYALDS